MAVKEAVAEKRVRIKTRVNDVPTDLFEDFARIIFRCNLSHNLNMQVEVISIFTGEHDTKCFTVAVTAPEDQSSRAELAVTIPLDDWAH